MTYTGEVRKKIFRPPCHLKRRSGLANLAEEATPRENRGDAVLCTARKRLRVCRSSRLRPISHKVVKGNRRVGGSEMHLSVSVGDESRASSLPGELAHSHCAQMHGTTRSIRSRSTKFRKHQEILVDSLSWRTARATHSHGPAPSASVR